MFKLIILTAVISLPVSIAVADSSFPDGGGNMPSSQVSDELSNEQRQLIFKRLKDNRERLRRQGLLGEKLTAVATHPLFIWPLATSLTDPGFYGIGNFVDQNPDGPGLIQDYYCGTRSYDRENGYDHRGMDVSSWPFPWLNMDNDAVEVVAAAAGTVIDKVDGNFDRNCSFTGNWNAVYIEHVDGSVAWYGHLKNGSLTVKTIGQQVEAGEYLGVVGSSGQSSGPHLHFEVYDSNDMLIEPFAGSCNVLNDESWWQDQEDYYESGINKVATHDAVPVHNNGCGVTESPNYKTEFSPGERARFAVYLRDQLSGQKLELKIIQPDGSTWQSWEFSPDMAAHHSRSWWYWSRNLPDQPQPGQWHWQLGFEGQVVESSFSIGGELLKDGFEDPPVFSK